MRERKFTKQKNAAKALSSNSAKYLSPVAKADLEYKAMKKTPAASSKLGKGFYKRGNASNISMATVFSSASLAGSPQLSMLLNDDYYIDSEDRLIDDFLSIIEMDGHHLPTLVHLGKLYLDSGNLAFSEYWLERAVKRGKARGSGGGKSGLATFYGGVTALWGHKGWSLLEQVMKMSDREDASMECRRFADKFSVFSGRGFECLSRLFPVGDEW